MSGIASKLRLTSVFAKGGKSVVVCFAAALLLAAGWLHRDNTLLLSMDNTLDEWSAPAFTILNAEDREAYEAAFRAIARGDAEVAKQSLDAVTNPILKKDVEALALISAKKIDEKAVSEWLLENSDHPLSEKLAASLGISLDAPRGAASAETLQDQVVGADLAAHGDAGRRLEQRYAHLVSWNNRSNAETLWRNIHEKIRDGETDHAAKLLQREATQPVLKKEERDIMRTSLAAGLFAAGRDQEALDQAKKTIASSGEKLPHAYWVAGIASWRLGQADSAAIYFSRLEAAPRITAWERSSAAYWAFRAFAALGNDEKAEIYLSKAASHPESFYGLLANQRLLAGKKHAFAEAFGAELLPLFALDAVKRSLALSEIGERELAAEGLEVLSSQVTEAEQRQMVALADELSLPPLQMAQAKKASGAELVSFTSSRMPAKAWLPSKRHGIDANWMLALAQQESRFNPSAVSPSGAVGLMQLLPSTAEYVARQASIRFAGTSDLYDPRQNMRIGQAYLAYLMKKPEIGNNLVALAAAYNAGPGNFARWEKHLSSYKQDPLLFIESLPSRETRYYVKQVMTNYWIYSLRHGEDVASLNAMMQGEWPAFEVEEAPDKRPDTRSL